MSLRSVFFSLRNVRSYYLISLFAFALAAIDTFYVRVSWVTVALLCVGAVPWIVQYVSELELPGGWKISTRELAKLGQDSAQILQSEPIPKATEETFDILADNPDIALAGLRIEFERKLVEIAKLCGKGVSERAVSLTVLARYLRDMEVLRSPEVNVLLDLIPVLNDAVHARRIDAEVRKLVMNSAKPILAYLEVRAAECRAAADVRVDSY